MDYKRPIKDLISPYNVEIPNDDLIMFCKKGYMKNPLKTAFIDLETGEEWTFKKFEQKRIELGETFDQLGVKHFDRIFLMMENRIEYFVVVFAALSLGACVVLVNQQCTQSELANYFEMMTCRFVVTSTLHSKAVADILRNQHSSVEHAVVLKEQGYDCLFNHQCLTTLDRYTSTLGSIRTLESSKLPAFAIFSSGTTGKPKGALLSHKNYVSALCQYRHPSFDSFEDTNYCIVYQPLAHGYGVFRMLYCLSTSTTILLMKKFKLDSFFAAVQKYELTSLNLVPPIAVMMTSNDLIDRYDVSSLKCIYSSAAPMGAELEDKLKKTLKGIKIIQAYALTECTGIAMQIPNEGIGPAPRGTVGFLYANTTCRVIDPKTKEVIGPYEEGEILIKGPQNMMGYLNDEKATKETIDQEGFVHTGDAGYYDRDGFFFITDRLKEMIKYNGMQVAPAELESLLLSHPCIGDAAVTWLPSALHGQLPQAWVVLRKGKLCAESEIVRWIEDKVASHKRLRGGVRIVKEIPKSASGKILRRVMRDMTKKAKL